MFTSLYTEFLNVLTFFFLKFFYIEFSDLILLLLLSIISWNFFTVSSFRYKLYYFLLSVILMAIWGFSASFDGLVLMMLVTEFTITLFFLFLFVTSKFKTENNTLINTLVYVHIILVFGIYMLTVDESYSTYFFFFQSIYPFAADIVAHDLAILYLFILYLNPILTIYMSIILGLFSLFFICLFFSFKYIRQINTTVSKETLTLRKQVLHDQSWYRTRIRIFQKKNVPKR